MTVDGGWPYKYPELTDLKSAQDFGIPGADLPPSETQPVLHFPVAGPDPFNTLVIITQEFYQIPEYPIRTLVNQQTVRYSVTYTTNFTFPGWTGQAPKYQQSTTASLSIIQFQGQFGQPFTAAIDAIAETGFDPKGNWFVKLDHAWQIGNDQPDAYDPGVAGPVYLSFGVTIATWLLCTLPRSIELPSLL